MLGASPDFRRSTKSEGSCVQCMLEPFFFVHRTCIFDIVMSMDEEIYREHILNHSSRPRNKGALPNADVESKASNPSCGDSLCLYLALDDDGKVSAASFEGQGCAVSQAAASMLTDAVKGKGVDELRLITPGDVYTMLGIRVSPSRSKCALLAYGALGGALKRLSKTNA